MRRAAAAWGAALMVLACCMVLAGVVSHKVATALVSSGPLTAAVGGGGSGATSAAAGGGSWAAAGGGKAGKGAKSPHQANIDWLWKQGPPQAVKARTGGAIQVPQPVGSPKLGGGPLTKSVPAHMAQQFLGLGGGVPRLLRRISVKRQNLWTYGPAILGHKDFVGEGMVPPNVPIVGQA